MIRLAAILTGFVLLAGLGAAGLDAQESRSESAGATAGVRFLGRPPSDGPTVVRVSFRLQDINEIDDEAQCFDFNGILTAVWVDTRQAFDPAVEQVAEKTYSGDYQFNELSPAWYPQLVLANESGRFESQAVLLRVRPDGTSILETKISAAAEAELNMRRYPFDHQQLEAVFEVLGYGPDEVVLEAGHEAGPADCQGVRLPQWSLEEVTASVREGDRQLPGGRAPSRFVLSMDLQRESLFMLRLVILPLFLIVALSWSVFWIDRAHLGDRINISFVGILTAVAYQIVVGDILPQISYVTLMNAFLNLSFCTMCAAVLVNVWVGRLETRGDVRLADRLDHICRWAFPLLYSVLLLASAAIAFWVF